MSKKQVIAFEKHYDTWLVISTAKKHVILGYVKWHHRFARMCFNPEHGVALTPGVMKKISGFMQEESLTFLKDSKKQSI